MEMKFNLKKVFSLVLIIGCLIPNTIFANNIKGTTGVVKSDWVELRTEPFVPKSNNEKEKNANVIGPLMKGDTVDIISEEDKNGWVEVKVRKDSAKKKVSGKKGYVAKWKLDIKTDTTTNDTENTTFVTVKNKTKFMKIAAKSNKKDDIYYTFGAGDKVKYISTDKNGWAKVENLAGTIGYCDARDLNLKNSNNTVSTKPQNNNTTTNSNTNTTTNSNTNTTTNSNNSNKYNVLVSSYTTTIPASTDGRLQNINLAASRVHKKIIMPGGSLDFGDLISDQNGKITMEDGYKKAPVIINGVRKEGTGGGVCQVSSTIYVAALEANIAVDESYAHSLRVGYIDPGLDASYATGAKNLVIRNDKKYPLELSVIVNGNKLTAEFRSTHDINNGCKYRAYSKQINKTTFHAYVEATSPDGKVSSELKRISTYRK